MSILMWSYSGEIWYSEDIRHFNSQLRLEAGWRVQQFLTGGEANKRENTFKKQSSSYMGMGQNLVALVNIKIAGKWMFIPLKMVCIGIDP